MVQDAKGDYQIKAVHITIVRSGIANAKLASSREAFLSIVNVSSADVNAKIIYVFR
jgi:hypothetical protein